MKNIAVLGSTGSIGSNTLEVARKYSSEISVCALSTAWDLEILLDQVKEFKPAVVSLLNEKYAKEFSDMLDPDLRKKTKILFGEEGNCAVATHEDATMVVSSIVGFAGLKPTYEAIRAGKEIALANKEVLVAGGSLIMKEASRKGIRILPIDSEHNAVFQCFEGHRREDFRKIILTASGGPFLKRPESEFDVITVKEALNHPRWVMGPKITIDSASLMNKALEIIEARWLFDLTPDQIEVIIHPESIVHSMVEYKDGNIIAAMAVPDMKGPIAYAVLYPARCENVMKPLRLHEVEALHFIKPDTKKFPSLNYAFEVIRKGGSFPAVLNAANEVVVQNFLDGNIKFSRIFSLLAEVLERHDKSGHWETDTLESVISADEWGRQEAGNLLGL